MGKKKGTTSSGATAGASKANLDCTASTISKCEENKMRSLGLISSAEYNFRHPGSASRPKPPKGFTVMFVDFLQHGLSLPSHEFLRSLLFFYGFQLWQLTPNSILHLSIFITVCKAFLGIDPHWGLWRRSFMSNATMAMMAPAWSAVSASLSRRSSEDDDDVPLSKRAKILSTRRVCKGVNAFTGDDWMATPPPRTVVAKVPLSIVDLSASASAPSALCDHLFFLHHHHHAVVLLEFGGDLPHLRCPLERGEEGLHRHRTRDRVRKCCRIAALGMIVYINNEI
ncbi:hypothetical protein QYE76_003970 [Lolium multiflorum]|uniref:Transposase (putative) gypsy type domain-containing protein n=1 Tax=Lolium multiflorum TaxID=4521 RepID=A0AAD8VZC0_LOLMU|nr:hypothetical protein QYE76_003970 [Lolium multiflorum]